MHSQYAKLAIFTDPKNRIVYELVTAFATNHFTYSQQVAALGMHRYSIHIYSQIYVCRYVRTDRSDTHSL